MKLKHPTIPLWMRGSPHGIMAQVLDSRPQIKQRSIDKETKQNITFGKGMNLFMALNTPWMLVCH